MIRRGRSRRIDAMSAASEPAPAAPPANAGPSTLSMAAYAAPQLTLAALYFPVFLYLPQFYAAERGVDLVIIGLIVVAVRLLDAVTDPLMGVVSDEWRTRFGRRKIWLVISAPLVCVSVWFAFVPPDDIGPLYVGFWLTALALSWTMALTPYFAWGAELATDYTGRARVTAWREAFFIIGTLVAAVVYALASEQSAGAGLEMVALIVVLATPVLTIVALVGAPEPRDRSAPDAPRTTVSAMLRALRSNAPFRQLLASQFVASASNALPAALFIFFVTNVLGADTQTAGALLVLYFVAGVLGIPFWTWAAKRFSKHRAWCWAMIFNAGAFMPAVFLGEGDVAIFFVITLLTGLAFGADVALPPAIQADVVDVDTAESGCQRTGVYMAAWSVATKVAGAIAGGAGLWVLGVAGFDAGGDNGPDALFTLALLYAGVSSVLKLVSVSIIWRYGLDADAQAALERRIDAAASAGKR